MQTNTATFPSDNRVTVPLRTVDGEKTRTLTNYEGEPGRAHRIGFRLDFDESSQGLLKLTMCAWMESRACLRCGERFLPHSAGQDICESCYTDYPCEWCGR